MMDLNIWADYIKSRTNRDVITPNLWNEDFQAFQIHLQFI